MALKLLNGNLLFLLHKIRLVFTVTLDRALGLFVAGFL